MLKEDCLDLPEKIYMKRHVALTKEQENLYEQMRKTAIANLNGKPCMKNCVSPTKIIGKARDIDVTPEDEKS